MARDHRDVVERGAAAQEGRQRADARASAGARSTRSTSASAASTARPRRRELRAAASSSSSARASSRSRRCAGPAGSTSPTSSDDYEFVALRAPGRLPDRARAARLERRARHRAAPSTRSTSPRSTCRTRPRCTRGCASGGAYLVGPLARYALNLDRLSPLAREAARRGGPRARLPQPVPQHRGPRGRDPLRARRGAAAHRRPTSRPTGRRSTVAPRAGTGYGWTEAPRGMLYHRYELDADGHDPRRARSSRRPRRTRRTIEEDLRALRRGHLDLPDDELHLRCEQAIRNYDPCISCATHFLDLEVDRG